MLQESQDLRAEADALHGFLETLGDEDWGRPTGFKGWTPWDVVAHLHFYDRVSLLSLEGEEAFVPKRAELLRAFGKGTTNAEFARQEYGGWSAAELLERWITTCHDMAKRLGESDPKPARGHLGGRRRRASWRENLQTSGSGVGSVAD